MPAVGGGSEWSIGEKDTAEKFAESDVTVTHQTGFGGATQVAGESLELKQEYRSEDLGPQNVTSYVNDVANYGIVVNPNSALTGLEVYLEKGSDVELQDSTGTTLETVAGVAGNAWAKLSTSLSANTDYIVRATTQSTIEYKDIALPISGADVDMVAGIDPAGNYNSTRLNLFTGVRPYIAGKSGSVALEWPYPPDVYSWDRATFLRTLATETVDVYVEESTDGGSTWTEIAGPISRGDKIPAKPENEVRFRVDFSRASTANNPTLDSIYRRWVV